MSKKSPYGTKTLYAKFELYLWGVRMGGNSLKFWKYYRGAKNKVLYFLSFWCQKVSPVWEDSKSGPKLESDNILPPFRPNNCRNLAILAILPVFDRFRQFFGQNGGQMLSDFTFETTFGILLSRQNFLPTQWKKIENVIFWSPYSISKTSTNWCPSLHLTDGAQISYIVFWCRKATF